MSLYVGSPGMYCKNMIHVDHGYTKCKLTKKQCIANEWDGDSYCNNKNIVEGCPWGENETMKIKIYYKDSTVTGKFDAISDLSREEVEGIIDSITTTKTWFRYSMRGNTQFVVNTTEIRSIVVEE